MARSGKVSINDVAERAGVSIATVSRCFVRPHLVSKKRLEKVLRVAEGVGYVAHGAARALAMRRSLAFGAVVPTVATAMFAGLIDAFQQRLNESGFMMLLATSDYDAKREYLSVRRMLERSIDGIMIVGAKHEPQVFTTLQKLGAPFVQVLATPRPGGLPSIGYDSRSVSRLVVDHLTGLGHREFGMVVGNVEHNDRVTNYVRTMRTELAKRGLRLPNERIVRRPYTIQEGRAGFIELAQRGSLPTAIVCSNDTLASGVVFEALAQGFSIPGDLSVVGLGDQEFAAHMSRPLTTVSFSKVDMGRLAAEYLLGQVEGKEIELPPEQPVHLVVRDTTGISRRKSSKPTLINGARPAAGTVRLRKVSVA